MAKLSFDALSTDIKALIIDHIHRPSDLKNVCLVNKQLHELAVKPLYYYVQLDLGSTNDNALLPFLNPRNKGLPHIRRMRLFLAPLKDSCNQDKQASLVIRMLLEFLPEDVLEEFSWCPWKPFSADNLFLLFKKQKKMKLLDCMDCDRNVLPQLKKDPKLQSTVFAATRQLHLYPENRTSLRLCGYFVQKTADHIENLAVHTDFLRSSIEARIGRNHEYIEPAELNDSATGPGLLMSTMFAHMLPFDKCTPFQHLKYLRLESLNLRHSDMTWCKIVNFTNIEYLRIHSCTGADSLLGQLSKSRNLPKTLKLLHLQHSDNADNEALLALDAFLCLTSGLQELVINLKNVDALPAAAGIARHGKTLQLLNVHGSKSNPSSSLGGPPSDDSDELTFNVEAFTKICTACTSLQQLSCAWPDTSLVRAPTDNWEEFSDQVKTLTKLVTLQISNFPGTWSKSPGSGSSSSSSSHSLPKVVYLQLLQGLATGLFQPLEEFDEFDEDGDDENEDDEDEQGEDEGEAGDGNANPNENNTTSNTTTTTTTITTTPTPANSSLRLVAFGISNRIYEREDSKHQHIYLRSTALDCEGQPQIHATPVSWCLRKYIEPRSDVLDIILHRVVRSPWRDSSPGSVSGLAWGGGEDDDV